MDIEELQKRVESILRQNLAKVLPRPRAFGAEADFLAQTSDERTIVVEVKQGVADDRRIRQAYVQVTRQQELMGATTAIIVFEHVPLGVVIDEQTLTSYHDVHLIDLDNLADVLQLLNQESLPSAVDTGAERALGLVLQPAPESQTLLNAVIVPVAHEVRATLTRLTTIGTTDVWRSRDVRMVLRDCKAVIVDVSSLEAGVMFLLGYSLGMNKKVIALAQSPSDIHVAGTRLVQYDLTNLDRARQALSSEIRRVLGTVGHETGSGS